MPEDWDWSDLFEDEEANSQPQKVDKNDPKSLRQFARKMAEENKLLKEQFAKVATESRSKTIADKVAEKSLPAKVAQLVPANVTVDKLDDWLKEYSDLWPTVPADDGQQGGEGMDDPDVVEERAALARISSATGATVPATRPADLMAQVMDPTQTRDGLLKLIEQAGGGYGTG